MRRPRASVPVGAVLAGECDVADALVGGPGGLSILPTSGALATPADTAIVDGRRTAQLAQRIDATVLGLVVVNAADDADRTAIESAADLPVVGVVPRDPAVADAPVVATDDPSPDTPAAGYDALGELLAACAAADDPLEAVETVDSPPMPGAAEERDRTEAEDGADDDPDVDEIVSRHGTRMGATRREVIRDQVRDAVEGTGDDRDRDS